MSIDEIKRLPPVRAISDVEVAKNSSATQKSNGREDFQHILQQKLEAQTPLTFSAHANARLQSRSIQLTDHQMTRLNHGLAEAARKGARESLVVLDHLAFIVSVSSRKVITAVDSSQNNGNVFTQIDSAVIV